MSTIKPNSCFVLIGLARASKSLSNLSPCSGYALLPYCEPSSTQLSSTFRSFFQLATASPSLPTPTLRPPLPLTTAKTTVGAPTMAQNSHTLFSSAVVHVGCFQCFCRPPTATHYHPRPLATSPYHGLQPQSPSQPYEYVK